ncbi:MAG: inositol monophosphatase [Rikenellaceae bacterium]|nr:inositol monophosphatase [Rikenellaceae bacterium]
MAFNIDYRELCFGVCTTARKAGGYIAGQREIFTPEKIEEKGAHDLVSYVDKEAEKMIVDDLSKLLPGAGFITEEGTAGSDGQEFRWVVDPLDGTTNFIHGLPPYCVSIALIKGDEVVIGVVYEITLGETFYAWEDSPSYLDGREIRASGVESLRNCLIAVGFSYLPGEPVGRSLDRIAWYQENTDGIRRIGSAAADLVWVACGRLDAFFQRNLAPWDVAAGAFIARRAGAVVSDNSGGGNYIFGREIVASNRYIYEEFIKTVR